MSTLERLARANISWVGANRPARARVAPSLRRSTADVGTDLSNWPSR
jgi:hypothetical protein